MLAISIVLFVVPDNSYLVMFQHYFTCRVSLFRNQNLNIQKKAIQRLPKLHNIHLKLSYSHTNTLPNLHPHNASASFLEQFLFCLPYHQDNAK